VQIKIEDQPENDASLLDKQGYLDLRIKPEPKTEIDGNFFDSDNPNCPLNRPKDWKTIAFADLKHGDKFRLFDDNDGFNTPVIDADGKRVWFAVGTPYPDKNGVLTIAAINETPTTKEKC
jgi:hypothetical protein